MLGDESRWREEYFWFFVDVCYFLWSRSRVMSDIK